MRFTKPSFRTKNALKVVISPTGKYLAQIGARISIYDINKRELVAEHKFISNECFLGFTRNDSKMFVENTVGEIVIFEPESGEIISRTKKSESLGQGSQACFSNDGKYLFCPSWDQRLIVKYVKSCEEVNQYSFDNTMLSGLVKIPSLNKYAFALTHKHPVEDTAQLFVFNVGSNKLNFKEILPSNDKFKNNIGWHEIDTFAICANESNLLFVVDPKTTNAKQFLVIFDIENNIEKSIEMDATNNYIKSIALNSNLIAVAVDTNLYETGMPISEYQELNSNTETEHLVFYDAITLDLICKIHWPDLQEICFHPNGKGMAIASHKNSGYVDDFTKFSKELLAYS